jgi:hypothetical protein
MSCFPGKCHILGVTEIGGEKAYVLEFLQARQPDLVRRPFFAKYNPDATWYDQLEPFSEADKPFFISPEEAAQGASGQSEASRVGNDELSLN